MRIKILTLAALIISCVEANSTLLTFYKSALENLAYDNTYALQKQSNQLSIKANKMRRFLNLNGGAMYGYTKAQSLPKHFNTTDIGITDTIDIFNKSANDIRLIQLQIKEDKFLMQIKKEQLFLSLTDMIVAYRTSEEKWKLNNDMYLQQKHFLSQMRTAEKAGEVPAVELSRFENNMALLRVRVNQEKQIIDTMRSQLLLYGKNKPIPKLSITKLHGNLEKFLSYSPQLKLNDTQAEKSRASIEKIKSNWMPDALIGANKQFNNDPTGYGDNYTLSAGITMSFDGGRSYDMESQKVKALQIQSQSKELEVQRAAQYTAWKHAYLSAKLSLLTLKKNLRKSDATLQNIKTAYFKHYIDLNSYLQTMQEYMNSKETMISEKYNMIKSAVIINTLSKGIIYE